MKKIIFSTFVVLVSLASCQKNNAPEIKTSGIPMTLTATIGGQDTKISYEEEDNVLKAAWEEGDKLSVLTLDANHNLISNDIFTAQSAGKTVDFSGTYTNDPEATYVWVYYPAMTEGEGTEDNPWHAPKVSTYEYDWGTLAGSYVGAQYISYYGQHLQKQQDDYSYLSDLTVLQGEADVDEMKAGELVVELNHRSYVIKVDFELPEEDMTIYDLEVFAKPQGSEIGSAESVPVSNTGWTNIYSVEQSIGGRSSSFRLCYGANIDSGTGTGLDLEGSSVTGYIVGYAASYYNPGKGVTEYFNMAEGDYFYLEASVGNGVEWYDCVATHTFTKDVTFENGKMYRLSATLEKED